MDENIKKFSCTFTGHRPERLDSDEASVIEWLKNNIAKAAEEGFTDFINGMQRGVDLWAAEEVLKLKKDNEKIRLIAACPFKGTEDRWGRDWQLRFREVIKGADEVHYISAKPGRKAFRKRNEWLVDHASLLLAVFTGAPGGTKYTMDYANKQGVKVIQYR